MPLRARPPATAARAGLGMLRGGYGKNYRVAYCRMARSSDPPV